MTHFLWSRQPGTGMSRAENQLLFVDAVVDALDALGQDLAEVSIKASLAANLILMAHPNFKPAPLNRPSLATAGISGWLCVGRDIPIELCPGAGGVKVYSGRNLVAQVSIQ